MSRTARGAIIIGVLALIALSWSGVQLTAAGGIVAPGEPPPPPYARTPPWTWPRAPEAGQAGWLPEPWGGTGTPEWRG